MNQIIKTMIEQVNRKPEREMLPLFIALGAKNMTYSDKDNSISMKVKGDRDVNYLKVSYNQGSDLYDVEFGKIRKFKYEVLETVTGLYNDMVTDAIWRRVVLI